MTTFNDLPIGQHFKLPRSTEKERIKIRPIHSLTSGVRYNAKFVDGDSDGNNYFKIGHSAIVLVPPYGDTTQANRQRKRYHRIKAMVQAAGWKSISEMETAMLDGAVDVPQKIV